MLDVDGFWQPNATIDLAWRGPKATHRNIDDEEDLPAMPPTVQDRPFPLTLPAKVGPYEARYTLCAPRLVLARWPLRVKRAEITLTAPERAKAASEVEVVASGKLAKAQKLSLRDASGNAIAAQPLVQTPDVRTRMRMPFVAGRYELVVEMAGSREPLTRRRIEVEATPIVIDYPDHVVLGEAATLDWPLAGALETSMSVWSMPAPGKPASEVWPRLRPGKLRLIAAPGDYEFRLFHQEGVKEPRLIARKTVKLSGRAFAEAPTETAAGGKLTVRLAITGEFFDRVMFVPRGGDRPKSLFDEIQPRGQNAVVPVPEAPGSYDLVYRMGDVGQRMIVERVPVEVR